MGREKRNEMGFAWSCQKAARSVYHSHTLRSWVREYQKHEAVPGARGRPSAVSNSRLEWARTRVKELQQSKKGAVSSSQLREVLNTAFQHTQLEHHHTPDVGEMGRFAMHTTVSRATWCHVQEAKCPNARALVSRTSNQKLRFVHCEFSSLREF